MNKITALLIALFFFFLMSEAAQPVNADAIIGNSQTITSRAQTANCIWVGTNNGLYIINTRNQKTTHLTAENSVLPSNQIAGIAVTAIAVFAFVIIYIETFAVVFYQQYQFAGISVVLMSRFFPPEYFTLL